MVSRLSAQSKPRIDVSLRRALCVATFIVFWMLAIGGRLVYLQVSKHDDLVERARKQQQGAIEISPERGQLLDRLERPLARSITTESIFADPSEIETACLEQTVEQLASVIDLDRKALSRQLVEAKECDERFVWIGRRLGSEQADRILGLHLRGVHSLKEPKRFYPNGSLAAHVLGFVGLDGVGLGGVEKVYNQKVGGEAGKLFVDIDARGRAYGGYEVQSQPGQTVVLTIDQSVQYRAEQALLSAVQRSHAKSGTVIVLDPHTGEILALANAPTYDPNLPGNAPEETRKNRALQDIYEPGSTFKIVAYSTAIEKGLVKPEDHINCQMGSITVAGRLIHDHHAFGLLTIADALAKSSNVAAIKLGLRVGDQSMHDYMTRFGFGSRTGVELPGETAGQLRPVSRWQASSIGSIAIGQEVGVTPLQMAAAFGTLANGGVRISPHVVREIRTTTGATVFRSNPERRQVISAETAKALRGMLEGVTLKGTAKKARLDGYSAAGKTGTAQKIDPKTKTYSKTKYVASFVGFAPVENPALVIIVVVDEPVGAHHGGDIAAPVFAEIAEQILPDLGVAPDIELKSAPPDLVAGVLPRTETGLKLGEGPQRDEAARKATLPTVEQLDGGGGEIVYAVAAGNAILMPDLRGQSVRDATRACAQLGIPIEAHGEGRVRHQSPSPGAEIGPGRTAYIDLGRVD